MAISNKTRKLLWSNREQLRIMQDRLIGEGMLESSPTVVGQKAHMFRKTR